MEAKTIIDPKSLIIQSTQLHSHTTKIILQQLFHWNLNKYTVKDLFTEPVNQSCSTIYCVNLLNGKDKRDSQ